MENNGPYNRFYCSFGKIAVDVNKLVSLDSYQDLGTYTIGLYILSDRLVARPPYPASREWDYYETRSFEWKDEDVSFGRWRAPVDSLEAL